MAETKFKRGIIFAFIMMTTILIMGAMNSAEAAGKTFSDVSKSNWAYESIITMSEKQIIVGYPDGSYKPGGTLTYGEFLKMVMVALKHIPEAEVSPEFSAIIDPGNAVDDKGRVETNPVTGQKKHWAQNYYDKAIERNFFTKYDIHEAALPNPIDREHMALIINTLLKDISSEKYEFVQQSMKDAAEINKYPYEVSKAYVSGILTGYEDGSFKPANTLTRAEAAAVLCRLTDPAKRVIPDGVKGLTDEEVYLPEKQPEKDLPVLSLEERLEAGGRESIGDLIESSPSRLPVEQMITNDRELLGLRNVKYYEIITKPIYGITVEKTLAGGECIMVDNADYARSALIVTKGIGKQLGGVSDYFYIQGQTDKAFPRDFDYIGFYNVSLDTILLIPNPLR